MRMHSYGKFSPSLIIGALLVFSVIVLYNYWSISALNHDLTLKIHSLEQQIISMSKTNDALQSNLEKVEEIREKVEVNLQKEQISEQQAKDSIKSLMSDLEIAKQETLNYKEENNAANSKIAKKDKEISNLKEKVVSLQAQIVEKDNKIGRIEKDLDECKKSLAKSPSTTKSTSAKPSPGNGPVNKPGTIDDQPVLMVDQAEREMKPPEGAPSPPGASSGKGNEQPSNVGSGEVGVGVIPVPGQPGQQVQQPLSQQGNLDAQEDDGDRPIKDELIQQDDQSPDGDLPPKDGRDNAGVGPAPVVLKEPGHQKVNPGSGQQEEREAAHLRAPMQDNNFDTNNNL